jgi:hypothetical protein
LLERSLRENAGRGGPAVDANCAHAFAAVSASGSYFGSVFFRLPSCLYGAGVVMPRDLAGNSREPGVRLTRPAGATSTPSMITVATETPSGMDRNINGIIGI